MDECKRSGQIPAFGNWDYANELPITQYFESARQAGLIRYSSSTGECDAGSGDLYDAVHFNKPHLPSVVVSSRKTRGSKIRKYSVPPHIKEHSKEQQVVVKYKMEDGDVQKYNNNNNHSESQQHKHDKQQQQQKHFPNPKQIINNYHCTRQQTTTTTSKPVDEDLYKIPPELLHTSKRKRMLGFLPRCLVPGCIV